VLSAPKAPNHAFGQGRKLFPVKVCISLVAICLLTGTFIFFPFQDGLVIRYLRSGDYIASIPVSKGDSIYLSYRHSVNKGEVVDRFLIDSDGSLVLTGSVFESFGAGMSDGFDEGIQMKRGAEGLELEGLHLRLGSLRVAVGSVANHRLRVGKKEIKLASIAEPLRFIDIAYKKIPLIRVVQERMLHGKP